MMTLDPNNSFADLVPGGPTGDAGFTGYIPGAPKPEKWTPPSGYTGTPDRLTPIPGGPADKDDDESPDPLKDAINNLSLDELLNGVKRARKQVGTGWATGTWGWVAEMKPGGGTPRDDFKASLDTIQGGIIMEKLQALKEASKTGASGMGALSEREGARLAAAVSALSDQMSPEELETSFKEIERHALVLKAVRDGKDPDDPAVRAEIEAGVGALPGAPPSEGTGGNGDPGIGKLSPEQEQAYAAFVSSFGGKPPPDKLKAFLEKLTGKQVANAEEIAGAIAGGRGFSTTTANLTQQEKVRQRMAVRDAPNPIQTLVTQGATLNLSDEAAGVGEGLANIVTSPFTGNFDPIGAYTVGRDVERQNVTDARNALGWAGTGLEVGGAILGASPSNALAALAPITNRQAITAAGAGGAVAGFGGGEGAQQSALGAMFGGAGGAGLQAIGGRVIDRFARSGGRGMDPEAAAASEAEGVDLIRPMVDERSRGRFGALESSPVTQNAVRGGLDRVREQIEGRVGDLARGGVAMETEAAGQVVQGAARRFIQRSRGVADRLYNRARNLAGDTRVTPRAALAQMRQEMLSLRETPTINQGEISFLNELGEELSQGPLSVEAIRGLRASVRGRINERGLTASQAEARALRIIDSLQQDVASSLPRDAATAFRRADAFYRERMVHIDDIVDRFIGGKGGTPRLSGEQAFQKLKGMTSPGGDNRRLAGLMRDLEPAERQDIAATIAQSLGRRAPDEPFQLGKFLDQTSKLSPAARRTIFGADGAQSIENLRTLTQRLQEAGGDFNRSRTAQTSIRNVAGAVIANLTGVGGGAAVAGSSGAMAGAGIAAAGMAVSAGRKMLSARAMLNPRVSRWLAQAANVQTPSQAQEATRYLGVIISREPALAIELQPIHDMLTRQVTPRLAAEEPEGNDDE